LIPSRPLSVFEIISETFGIFRRILLRYWILFAVLVIPGAIAITVGLQTFAINKVEALQHDLRYSDNDLTSLRDEVRAEMRRESPVFELEEQALGVHDTLSAIPGTSHMHTVRMYLISNTSDLGTVGLIAFGFFILLAGVLIVFAATVDLACQVFEERGADARDALRSAFRTHFFRMLVLHMIYWAGVVLIDVIISVIAGVSFRAAAMLSSFATVLEFYATIRLTVAVPSLVSEELRPMEAIKRSWQLTRGAWLRTLVIAFAFGLVLLVMTLVVSSLAGLVFPGVMEWLKQALSLRPVTFNWMYDSLPGLFWSITGEMTILVLLLGAFIPVLATVYYYDLRTRKDGPLMYVD
jgi:hypothetical protein